MISLTTSIQKLFCHTCISWSSAARTFHQWRKWSLFSCLCFPVNFALCLFCKHIYKALWFVIVSLLAMNHVRITENTTHSPQISPSHRQSIAGIVSIRLVNVRAGGARMNGERHKLSVSKLVALCPHSFIQNTQNISTMDGLVNTVFMGQYAKFCARLWSIFFTLSNCALPWTAQIWCKQKVRGDLGTHRKQKKSYGSLGCVWAK